MGLFGGRVSKSSYDSSPRRVVVEVRHTHEPAPAPNVKSNPDPTHFTIVKAIQIGSALVIKVHYPDATSYEGFKVLVYRRATVAKLKLQGSIDPHFSRSKKFLSPCARFEPTSWGWGIALAVATALASPSS